MAKIEDNPFYQATMSDKLTPFGKAQIIEAMLSAPGADTLKEFKEYKKFLTSERKRVSAEVIKMTTPDAFSELKAVINDLNKGIQDFDKNIKPLTDIIQSIQGLKMGSQDPTISQPVAEAPAAPPELSFDGVLDHSVSVRRMPLSLKTRYIMMRV